MSREEIVTRLGLDTAPFRHALRGASGLLADFSRTTQQSFMLVGRNWLKMFGVVGLVSGMRSLVRTAREAKNAASEFHGQAWVNPEAVSEINRLDDALTQLKGTLASFGTYAIGQLAKTFRLLGGLSVSGHLGSAQKASDDVSEADRAALYGKQIAAKSAAQRQSTASRDRRKTIFDQLQSGAAAVLDAQGRLRGTKDDLARLTLAELASIGPRNRFEAQQKFNAQTVQWLEQQAEMQRQNLNPVMAKHALNRAEELRRSLVLATQGERQPYKSAEDHIASLDKNMQALLATAKHEGIVIVPRMGN